jgi:hypothetical protein
MTTRAVFFVGVFLLGLLAPAVPAVSATDAWSQLGETFVGGPGEFLGASVALSADGSTLAMSAIPRGRHGRASPSGPATSR